jgi:hypothetical protein
MYENDENVRTFFRKVFIMAIMPPDRVRSFWEVLSNPQVRYSNQFRPIRARFVQYFNTYYMNETAPYPMALWNHYNTIGKPRTNNTIESLEVIVVLLIPTFIKQLSCFKEKRLIHMISM